MNAAVNILVTGATGNTGREVIRYLIRNPDVQVVAGVRNVEKARRQFPEADRLQFVRFDFEDTRSFPGALQGVHRVFLLRPPHISDVEKYFRPLIGAISAAGIREVMFLSVQGAGRSKVIPHNKIERLIRDAGPDYIFLRPSYFMQNLTTPLLSDIRDKHRIVLPAGKAKFNWIDVRNIGEAAAMLLANFSGYRNQILDLTGTENLTFGAVAEKLSDLLPYPVRYKPVNPVRFFLIKKREGLPAGLIMVMIMLHFLPRFSRPPQISHVYQELTGKRPGTLEAFVSREKALLLKEKPGL